MLHLSGPHLCPACNIVHDLAKERRLSKAVQSGADLRPYFGTFIQVANNGATTPIHFSTSGTFTGPGQSISITLDRTGFWVITATGNETGAVQAYRWSSGGTPQFTYSLTWPGGGSGSITIAPDADGSGSDAHSNAPFAAAPVGQVISAGAVTFSVTGTFATVINIPVTLQAWFVPTPTYPH